VPTRASLAFTFAGATRARTHGAITAIFMARSARIVGTDDAEGSAVAASKIAEHACPGQHRRKQPRTHVRSDARNTQRRSLDVLKPKKLRERADKGNELHADARLGKTMDALRECLTLHRRDPVMRRPVGALAVSANLRRRRKERSMN